MGRNDNLPPGVTTGMLPGNTSDDAAWEKFMEWAWTELAESDHMLSVEEAYMAVRAGIASVKATREDVNRMLKEARQDERISYEQERLAEHQGIEGH